MKTRTFLIVASIVFAALAVAGYAGALDLRPDDAGTLFVLSNIPIAGAARNAMMNSAASLLHGALDPQGRLNVNVMRPYLDDNGECRIVVNQGGGKFGSIVVNAPALLRIDEWRDIDRAVVMAGVDRLVGIADLESRGLIHNLGSIGITISTYEKVSEITPANVNMSGTTEGEKDTVAYDHANIPVPIVHKDFDVNIRRLVASRMFGESVDVTMAALASRMVAEKNEDMLFAGSPIVLGGADSGTIYGYLNHPDRNTVDMTTAWATATADAILDEVRAMAAAARADHFFGPYVIYIPGAYQAVLDQDYLVGDAGEGITITTKTIRQRIMELSDIADIKVADRLTGDNVVLVQLTRDVVDLAKAQGITTVNWQVMGGMQERFKVMSVQVPRIKSTFDGESGVVHLRPT